MGALILALLALWIVLAVRKRKKSGGGAAAAAPAARENRTSVKINSMRLPAVSYAENGEAVLWGNI